MEDQLAQQRKTIAEQEKTIDELKTEVAKLRAHIRHSDDVHLASLKESKAEDTKNLEKHEKRIEKLEKDKKNMLILLFVFVALFVIAFATICVAIVIDWTVPNKGFIWMQDAASFFNHTTSNLLP